MQALGWAAMALIAALAYSVSAGAQAAPPRPVEPFAGILDEHPVIQYATAPTRDPLARLREALASGTRSLEYRDGSGYLQSLLSALDISPESQLLVFSKTGIQRAFTGPQTPRALYYNDSVVVGYISGARYLEIASHDPQQGVVFYIIDQTIRSHGTGETRAAPEIVRRADCLSCHVSGNTMDVPGLITRSMFTARNGDTLPQLGSYLVDHRTPLSQRWGGYFVTGHDAAPVVDGVGHMGNVTTAMDPAAGPASSSKQVLKEWLSSAPESRGYPSKESDIVSLMVFDHQRHAINLLTRLNWEARVAASEGHGDFSSGPLKDLANEVADYFLFVDEVPPPARLTPRVGFAEHFAAAGPRDRQGRSLRQLDLERRLLRYPCSYMIDSNAFAHLPPAAKQAVYMRLGAVLTSRETDARYGHLSATDRRAIVDILRDTRHDLPEGWALGPVR